MALMRYVQPAKDAGASEVSIPVKNLLRDLETIDFPSNYTPLVCNSIRTQSFQRDNNLEIVGIDGPRSKTGTRVIVHYRILGRGKPGSITPSGTTNSGKEESGSRAKTLTDRLRGLLKQEIADYGGADAFMRWVRSEDEDAA